MDLRLQDKNWIELSLNQIELEDIFVSGAMNIIFLKFGFHCQLNQLLSDHSEASVVFSLVSWFASCKVCMNILFCITLTFYKVCIFRSFVRLMIV